MPPSRRARRDPLYFEAAAEGVDPPDREIPLDSPGGLLISVDFGDATFGNVVEAQHNVRRLVLASVSLAVAEHAIQEARKPDTQETLIVSPGEFARSRLRISSSVTVNPWQEVISFLATGGFGAAVVKGLVEVPKLLDLSIRISTLRGERQNKLKELRNAGAELDREFHEQLQSMRLPEAAAVREVLDDIAPHADSVRAEIIGAEEVARRRRAMLRLVHPPED
ncbi:hypothetical protein AB0L82_42675 [Nocardia sp. NPDC052001]|uniref:hypothetical protein n=1 Tax=Nocardia sp. NPDC052001 TaxID=3154853 RepID=UPI003445720C